MRGVCVGTVVGSVVRTTRDFATAVGKREKIAFSRALRGTSICCSLSAKKVDAILNGLTVGRYLCLEEQSGVSWESRGCIWECKRFYMYCCRIDHELLL